jgi:lipopolysaccharide transport system ATP-binding protein
MSIAIKIENLSKQYRLGLISTRTLSHDLNRWYQMNIRGKEDPYLKIGERAEGRSQSAGCRSIRAPKNNLKSPVTDPSLSPGNSAKSHLSHINETELENKSEICNRQSAIASPLFHTMPSRDYIWALRDINLEVEQGEVLGIIGKNGAGKSTLLKILSKVTAPTTGTVKARGRIASLLEVGTGFHPEMTGRENIYMNGAIMGMSKAEITRKLDEIVDFAGVETFIDTPVKRYSSGMTVRLGFAVAAHLEPEILVVDEVLAVGDAEFQKKAIGKMQDISKGEGRTVLFVSHNMAAVMDLCDKAIMLQNGYLQNRGTVNEVVANYLKSSDHIDISKEWLDVEKAPGNEDIKLRKLYAISPTGETVDFSLTNSSFGICIEYEVLREIPYFTHGINVYTSTGIHLFSSHDNNKYQKETILKKGLYSTSVWIPGNLLQEGDYLLNVAAMRYTPFQVLFHEKDLLRIQIVDTALNSAKHEDYRLDIPGIIRPKLLWNKRILKQT